LGITTFHYNDMSIPRWKHWLSYLFEFHVESAPSETNPHLYVSYKNGQYQLSTANAVYSYGNLYTNFSQVFEKMPLDDLPIQRVLLLGFGLGSIPLMLEQRFQQYYNYTAVEIDESVLYLANKYILPTLSTSIETIAADAFAFMAQNTEQYDLICMDVFLDDVVPEQFESDEFLENLKQALSPSGILLYNRLALTMKDVRDTRTFYEQQFQKHFPDGTALDVNGNWMLINRWDVVE